ncbi:MAG: homoserine dehydrogenase, partial [Rickettsiales bacterium]|nr:homoserine dehydrogenase [Rickettsiales bacterium]
MKTLRIAIAGLGTVGVGTYKILTEKTELLSKRSGTSIVVTAVSARSKKDRGVDLSPVTWVDNAVDLASMDNVDVVLELIGGESGIAYDLCKKALENGKHVVTANKALIAHHGIELASIAEEKNVVLAFEAAVAGGIPILKSLKEGLGANTFRNITGILNGTCNYILTEMEKTGQDFPEILKEAKDKGYAE